jgi:hypothetical protein
VLGLVAITPNVQNMGHQKHHGPRHTGEKISEQLVGDETSTEHPSDADASVRCDKEFVIDADDKAARPCPKFRIQGSPQWDTTAPRLVFCKKDEGEFYFHAKLVDVETSKYMGEDVHLVTLKLDFAWPPTIRRRIRAAWFEIEVVKSIASWKPEDEPPEEPEILAVRPEAESVQMANIEDIKTRTVAVESGSTAAVPASLNANISLVRGNKTTFGGHRLVHGFIAGPKEARWHIFEEPRSQSGVPPCIRPLMLVRCGTRFCIKGKLRVLTRKHFGLGKISGEQKIVEVQSVRALRGQQSNITTCMDALHNLQGESQIYAQKLKAARVLPEIDQWNEHAEDTVCGMLDKLALYMELSSTEEQQNAVAITRAVAFNELCTLFPKHRSELIAWFSAKDLEFKQYMMGDSVITQPSTGHEEQAQTPNSETPQPEDEKNWATPLPLPPITHKRPRARSRVALPTEGIEAATADAVTRMCGKQLLVPIIPRGAAVGLYGTLPRMNGASLPLEMNRLGPIDAKAFMQAHNAVGPGWTRRDL